MPKIGIVDKVAKVMDARNAFDFICSGYEGLEPFFGHVNYDASLIHDNVQYSLRHETGKMLEIKPLEESHVASIVASFTQIGWHKPRSLFLQYLAEQAKQERAVWVVLEAGDFVGYVTLKKTSLYEPFAKLGIPEISDLNVLPYHRKKGAGTLLLDTAETKAKEWSQWVGIGVGLSADYGQAQRLYIKRHYIPDGKGLTYQYKNIVAGHSYPIDDDLVLWFMKTT